MRIIYYIIIKVFSFKKRKIDMNNPNFHSYSLINKFPPARCPAGRESSTHYNPLEYEKRSGVQVREVPE